MQLVKTIRQMTTLAPRPQILIGSAIKKKPPRLPLALNSRKPVLPSNNVNLIQNVPNRRSVPSLKFNSQREIITFGFSIPKPRLTAGGFKIAKPRLLRQANTAKLKRPGIIRPQLPKLGVGAAPLRRPM